MKKILFLDHQSELGGGEVSLFSDINSALDKVDKVNSNDKFRDALIKKGLPRAKKFSWEKCAKDTYALYKEVYIEQKVNRGKEV